MIDVTCPQCGEVYHADPVHVGRQIRCTKCSSLLPILGAGGTIVQKPPEANGVRPFQPPSDAKSAPPSPRRTAVGLGSIVALVVVIAVGLVVLLWYSSPNKGTTSVAGQEPLGTEQEPQYEVVTPPPCDERAPRSSMPNGSRIAPDVGTNGYGVLAVQNGTNEDAVLSLYNTAADETIREVYLQAGHSVRMKGIPKGTYELAYTHGLDWVGDDIFRCGQDYAKFERQFAFTEEKDQEGVQYKEITVTLHQVVGGNVRTKRISRQEFLKNHRRTASLPR